MRINSIDSIVFELFDLLATATPLDSRDLLGFRNEILGDAALNIFLNLTSPTGLNGQHLIANRVRSRFPLASI